nr:hypothetical protein [Tanacetum cinerariifolium]
MRPLALRQARQPRSDHGKARNSVSSTSAHHNCGSSSRQENDDEYDGASRASTPSPTTYLNSLKLLNYQLYEIHSPFEQSDDLLFERQIKFLNQSQEIHKEVKGEFKEFVDIVKRTLEFGAQGVEQGEELRAQLFDRTSEQMDTTKGTSVYTRFRKQSMLGKPNSSYRSKLYYLTPLPKFKVFPKVSESNALSKPVTSNLVPSSQEPNVMKNDNMISLGIFRMNPFKASRVDNFVPNKNVKPSVRIKPITVSQPHVITKNDVNSKTNGISPKDVESTTRTRRP